MGAAVTLAAWTDQEWVEGIFGAGSFNIQGSIDGATFTDNESEAGAATLAFELEAAENLSPGDVVAAPFVLQLDGATTYDATVELAAASADGANAANLTYGIVTVTDAAACTVDATGDALVPAGTALGAVAGDPTFALTAGADAATGDPVTLCFQVTAGDELAQGEPASATWQFVGTSVE